MDENLKMLHYIAIGIIILNTIFTFIGPGRAKGTEIGVGKCVGYRDGAYVTEGAATCLEARTPSSCKDKTWDDPGSTATVDSCSVMGELNCAPASNFVGVAGQNDASLCSDVNDPGGEGCDYVPGRAESPASPSASCRWQPGGADDSVGDVSDTLWSIIVSDDSLTKWGKIFISLVSICLLLWNTISSNSNWLFSSILFGYIVLSYGGLQKIYNENVGKYGDANDSAERKTGCNYIISENSYYSAKFLELRIGYIFLIMIASIVICYRNIKGGCWNKDVFNTVLSIFSPLLMITGLLIISSMVTPSPDGGDTIAGGGAAMDYVLAFFRGAPARGTADTVHKDDWKKTLAFPTLTDRTGRTEAGETDVMNVTPTTDTYISKKNRLDRIKNRIYMKFIIVISILGFLVYSSVKSEISCGLDLNSVKTLIIKAPTYLIAVIVFSPFIIKNIIINETVIDYANLSYAKELDETSSGTGDNVTGTGASDASALTEFSVECMIDKMGGLEIYLLLCLLCLLMYAGEGTGYKLNMIAACVIVSLFVGNAMETSPSPPAV